MALGVRAQLTERDRVVPPSTIAVAPAATSGRSPSAICAIVRSALPAVTGRSPASTTERPAKTSTPWTVWNGRSANDADRIASGPKRGPGRKLVPVSNGTPTIADVDALGVGDVRAVGERADAPVAGHVGRHDALVARAAGVRIGHRRPP